MPNLRRHGLISALLLVPCFWQSRVQAGDLGSHIYNAWLAQLIESGHAQGLAIARQFTNVLFDLILSGLFRWIGPAAAQRIAVGIAVLVFVWGAFAFVTAISGQRPWHLMPAIAMLAYGWVFHMGFFNFYLSMGLCFCFLAAAWDGTPRRIFAALPILGLAYLAHALPVAWAAGALLYSLVARRCSPRLIALLTALFILVASVLRLAISRELYTKWSVKQLSVITGLDQVWVFDTKYYFVMMGLLAVWGLLFSLLIRQSGARRVFASVPFQLCLVSAAGIFLLPSTVLIPGFHHTLSYIAERMSLTVGICACALLASAGPRMLERCALLAVGALFFVFLYTDERALNAFEDRMQAAVSAVPPGARVVSELTDSGLRVNALTHMVDRVCIGRCFSYANYEASTAQFRIRALGPNPVVAWRYADSWHLQTGEYVVKKRDLPLYQIGLDSGGRMAVKVLHAGSPCGNTLAHILTVHLPES